MPSSPRTSRTPALARTVLSAGLAAVMVALGAGGPATAPPAVAVASDVTVSPGRAAGGNDFATQAYANPWDYSDADDQVLADRATMDGVSNVSISGGRLVLDSSPGGWVAPVVSFDDLGAAAWGRDGSLIPIDADRHTRISVHMRVDRSSTASVMWFTCGVAVPSCQGQKQFATTSGWRTYDIDLKTGTNGQGWRGLVKGLRLFPADAGGHAEIDWVRVYAPGGTATVRFADNTSSAPHVIWDADAQAANNDAGNPGWGRLDATGSGTSRTVQAAALPSGTYRIGVVDDGRTTYAPSPLVVDGPPAPVVVDPDRTGGLDFATVAGNAWDFDRPGDVRTVGNADHTIANGLLYANNRGPLINDPFVLLAQNGVIDGSRFHRLTVRMGHAGPWGLEDAPGGGMNSRIVWSLPGTDLPQVSDDLVVFPGWHTNFLDLATSPTTAILDPSSPGRTGWAGQQVTALRIDPNEDRGARQWFLDDVRLAEDDTAYGGAFDIRLRDLNWQSGTRATVRADTDRVGCDGTVVASDVQVGQGETTVRWAPNPVAAGTYWICVTMTDGTTSSSAYATGPLQMTSRPSPVVSGGSPIGSVDSVTRVPGGVQVSGWALDPDVVGPIEVHVYVNGRGVATSASSVREDIATAFRGYGSGHGFSVTVPATGGPQDMCAYAINVAVGTNTLLSCRRIDVGSTPVGSLDRTRQVPGGVQFDGWALDPDTADAIEVHGYVAGSGAPTRADRPREDIARIFPGYGAAHGFGVVVPVVTGGSQSLCAYAIDSRGGTPGVLGCPRADVRVDPWGALDTVRRVPGGVQVTGWTIDPSTSAALEVHVYVSGTGTAIRADRPRPDLTALLPEWGPNHGFDAVVPGPSGPVDVCAYGINQGPGGHLLLGCRRI